MKSLASCMALGVGAKIENVSSSTWLIVTPFKKIILHIEVNIIPWRKVNLRAGSDLEVAGQGCLFNHKESRKDSFINKYTWHTCYGH